jgi:hypothetical protein
MIGGKQKDRGYQGGQGNGPRDCHNERQSLSVRGNYLVVEEPVKEMLNQKRELLSSCEREQGVTR